MIGQDVGVGISHHFGGGVYAKETRIPAGVRMTQHVHKHDHLSVLAAGMVVVEVEGRETVHHGPACIVIKAGHAHSVRAVTSATWYCVHATDETDAALVDERLVA